MELLMKDLGTLGKILPRILPTELEFLMEDLGPLGKTLPRKEYPPPNGTSHGGPCHEYPPPPNWNFSEDWCVDTNCCIPPSQIPSRCSRFLFTFLTNFSIRLFTGGWGQCRICYFTRAGPQEGDQAWIRLHTHGSRYVPLK